MKKVYLIRHGTTEENKARILIGQSNPSLEIEVKDSIKSINTLSPDLLFSSPLKRAYETASLLFPGMEIIKDNDIMERGFGDFEGNPIEVIGKDNHGKNLYAFKDEKILVEHGGEPINQLEKRITRFIDRLENHDAKVIAVVSHGTLISQLVKVLFKEDKPRTSLRNLNIVYFELENGKGKNLRYNMSREEIRA